MPALGKNEHILTRLTEGLLTKTKLRGFLGFQAAFFNLPPTLWYLLYYFFPCLC
ncbi:hypothetical protein KC19_3G169200 [Ceratodon purpureus]|uniref:Uncharacterized protein n=1 Tax=Ceratodon purpureus TaxID=3225 RepID=A0A8T0IJF5_CERPU|nr:hypothetical protein KC19_3G169200 [Ceratodon purpureus]